MSVISKLAVSKNVFGTTWYYELLKYVSLFAVLQLFSVLFSSFGITRSFESIAENPSAIFGFITLMILVVILFFYSLLFTYSFFENLIWNTIYGKKTTFKNSMKFSALNILLFAVLAILGLVFYFIFSYFYNVGLKYVGLTILFLFVAYALYESFLSYNIFAQTQKVFDSVVSAFRKPNFHKGIVPFVISFVVFTAINIPFLAFNVLPETGQLIASAVALAAFLAWFRLYFSNAFKSLKNH